MTTTRLAALNAAALAVALILFIRANLQPERVILLSTTRTSYDILRVGPGWPVAAYQDFTTSSGSSPSLKHALHDPSEEMRPRQRRDVWIFNGPVGALLAGALVANLVTLWRRREVADARVAPHSLSGGVGLVPWTAVPHLLPRSDYDLDETGLWSRAPLMIGIFTGVWSGLFFGVIFSLIESIDAVKCVALCFCSGVAFGAVFTFAFVPLLRWQLRHFVDAAYAGDATLVQPPPGRSFTGRLLGSWMLTDNAAVPGVLYVGPAGLIFMPHQTNRARYRQSIELGPAASLELSVVVARLSPWRELLVERPPRYVQIRSPERTVRFWAPRAADTIYKLQKALGQPG